MISSDAEASGATGTRDIAVGRAAARVGSFIALAVVAGCLGLVAQDRSRLRVDPTAPIEQPAQPARVASPGTR